MLTGYWHISPNIEEEREEERMLILRREPGQGREETELLASVTLRSDDFSSNKYVSVE